jgi:hypothetical protein
MSNTADCSGKPIAVRSQSISGANAVTPFTTSMEEREVLFFYFISDTTKEPFLNASKYGFRLALYTRI